MRKIIVFVSFVVSISLSAQTSKEKKIVELLDLLNSNVVAKQGVQQFIKSYKSNYPQIPVEFWENFEKEINDTDLYKMYIPIYSQYYTEKDLDEILNFYKSPTGKRVIEVTPKILQESMDVGRQWGSQIAKKVIDELEKNHGFSSPPPPKQTK